MRIVSLLLLSLLLHSAHGQYGLDEQLKKINEQNVRLQEQQKAMVARMDSVKMAIIRRDLQAKGLPKVEAGEEVIVHAAHSLVYSE
ncbi:MAG TPA: hypothetical protein PK760_16160, partial [Flavobacteriales bacterium]|nr:hypothetical protein [Flavobacteriales bacterium]